MEEKEIKELIAGALVPVQKEVEDLKSTVETQNKTIEDLTKKIDAQALKTSELKKSIANAPTAPEVEEPKETIDHEWHKREFEHKGTKYAFALPNCFVEVDGSHIPVTAAEVEENEELQAIIVELFTNGATRFIKTVK
jgi:methionyl-tRNA formyltransferase